MMKALAALTARAAAVVVLVAALAGCATMNHAECHRLPDGRWHCSGSGV